MTNAEDHVGRRSGVHRLPGLSQVAGLLGRLFGWSVRTDRFITWFGMPLAVATSGQLPLGALVGGDDSRAAEADVVLQRGGDAFHLTLVGGAPQLPGQLAALG